MLVYHIFGSSRDNQLIGQLTKKSTIAFTGWLMGLHDCMVRLPNTNEMRVDGSKTNGMRINENR